MKKKKVMASLVLSAMMVGTLGTSVSASTWKPDTTPGTSSAGGFGQTGGLGIVTRERHEDLFLVAVPTSARSFRFYADPTGNTLDAGVGTFQFQNQAQKWSEKPQLLKDKDDTAVDKLDIAEGRDPLSNFVVAYNAGSRTVDLTVDANIILADAFGNTVDNDILSVETVAHVIADRTNYNPLVSADFINWKIGDSPTAPGNTYTGAIQQSNLTSWVVHIPSAKTSASNPDWIRTESLQTPAGLQYTKDFAVSLEEYNANESDENKYNEFKYPVALFRLKGNTLKPESDTWDIDGLTARLSVKWEIKDPANEKPQVDQVVVITDIENGNKVPVTLGKGSDKMNGISSVLWKVPAEVDPNGVGFTQELLGSLVKYVPTSGNTGNLVYDETALRTLYNYANLNGTEMQITFIAPGKDPVIKSFNLFVY